MANLEKFINDPDFSDLDPLTKMATIRYQFESIHPFYDGNGRTGRIINILYLVLEGLLDLPVLYLSRYIIQHKDDYCKALQGVRTGGDWQTLILYLLKGVEVTAIETISLVRNIKALIQQTKQRLRTNLLKVYSQGLSNNLFKNLYIKIEFLEADLNVSYQTTRKYLEILTKEGYLAKVQKWKTSYCISKPLLSLFLK